MALAICWTNLNDHPLRPVGKVFLNLLLQDSPRYRVSDKDKYMTWLLTQEEQGHAMNHATLDTLLIMMPRRIRFPLDYSSVEEPPFLCSLNQDPLGVLSLLYRHRV